MPTGNTKDVKGKISKIRTNFIFYYSCGMEKIILSGKNTQSSILIGESLSKLPDYIPAKNVFIITDSNISAIYSSSFPDYPVFSIVPGESSKSLENISKIYMWLLVNGANRNSFLLGIGGGVVCDIAGFVASTFMRGIDFGFVATSLLAQVDASVGGKNGVNLNGYKNIIGTINLPRFVICELSMLKTLPKEELTNGFSEIVKHALIADGKMFAELEKNTEPLLSGNQQFIEYLVFRSVQIKAEFVSSDEKEKNIRRKLNLGHTWGHAVEKVTGLPHGRAISIGLAFEAEFSVHKGTLSALEKIRIYSLLEKLGLPVQTDSKPEEIFEALLSDKKREADVIHFVLMQGIGNVLLKPVPFKELKQFALR